MLRPSHWGKEGSMTRFIVLIGNFGSGKTELALNMSIEAARAGRTLLIDLDIVNPYFRASERADALAEAGVELIMPRYVTTGVDVPSLPPEVQSAFVGAFDTVIFDVGGDGAGAVALGQFKARFDALSPGQLEVLMVVNVNRPLSSTPERLLSLIEQLEGRSRLAVTGLVNNANLSNETSAADLLSGCEILGEVSRRTGLPVRYTCGEAAALDGFLERAGAAGIDPVAIGRPYELVTLMHRDWHRFTHYGI